MLEGAAPEIVVIATPPHLHHAIALAAFARGAHVVCEKPLAMTATEARAMVDAAGRARRVAMTGFNWRFTPAMQELHSRGREGALGRPLHLALRWLGGRWAEQGAAAPWRRGRAAAVRGGAGRGGEGEELRAGGAARGGAGRGRRGRSDGGHREGHDRAARRGAPPRDRVGRARVALARRRPRRAGGARRRPRLARARPLGGRRVAGAPPTRSGRAAPAPPAPHCPAR